MSDDSDIERDQLILEFVNKLLTNMDKPQIKELVEFKNIYKNDLTIDINNELAKEYANKFIKYFKKNDIRYYEISRAKNYVLTLLKCIIKDKYTLDYRAKTKMKALHVTYDGIYSIVLNK
jgi:hypothetical protein